MNKSVLDEKLEKILGHFTDDKMKAAHQFKVIVGGMFMLLFSGFVLWIFINIVSHLIVDIFNL